MEIPDFSVPRQTARMPLEEALVFVQREVREAAGPNASQLSYLAQMQLLERGGVAVPAESESTEAALLFVLVMALVHFDQCSALILTASPPAADAFFSKRLFSPKGPTGRDLAFRCGKRLVAGDASDKAEDIGRVLANCNDILVVDLSTLQRIVRLAALDASGAEPEVAWWRRPVFSSAASAQLLVRQGLGKLNCVVKVLDGTVSTDDEVGVAPILRWAAAHEVPPRHE